MSVGNDQIVKVHIIGLDFLYNILLTLFVLVKLWDYQRGEPVCYGLGHAAVIVTCRYSPCGKYLVTGSADGAVFIWAVPEVIFIYYSYELLLELGTYSLLLSFRNIGRKMAIH